MADFSKRVLIVEDETLLTKALAHKVMDAGYSTRIAFDGNEALKILSQEPFDLILLDIMMPTKDGFAVLEELKNRKNTTPIIVTSNLSQAEDIKKAKDLGAEE